jgi:hypothetical protein
MTELHVASYKDIYGNYYNNIISVDDKLLSSNGADYHLGIFELIYTIATFD